MVRVTIWVRVRVSVTLGSWLEWLGLTRRRGVKVSKGGVVVINDVRVDPNKTRQDKRQGKTRQEKARQDRTKDKARPDKANTRQSQVQS